MIGMQVPMFGDVPTTVLVVVGFAGLFGYIMGSQIKTAVKLILILALGAMFFGLINPQSIRSLAELYVSVKPVLDDMLARFSGSLEPSLLAFGAGFAIGLWRG